MARFARFGWGVCPGGACGAFAPRAFSTEVEMRWAFVALFAPRAFG